MDVFEAIKGRRSVRAFRPDPVPQEDLECILDAARWAPSAGNTQPWRFLVVQDKERLAGFARRIKKRMTRQLAEAGMPPELQASRLAAMGAYLDQVMTAPVFIFVFVDTREYPDWAVHSGALAVQNLMLAAYALGYGTCFQTTFFPEEEVREHFAVPGYYKLLCAVPLGRPDQSPPVPPRKPLEELVAYESFS